MLTCELLTCCSTRLPILVRLHSGHRHRHLLNCPSRLLSSQNESTGKDKAPQQSLDRNLGQVERESAPYYLDPSQHNVRPAKKSRRGEAKNWIDTLRIYCKGGHGGNGFPQKGGCGGSGGNVIFKCSHSKDVPNLYHIFKKEFESDSTKQRLSGKTGENAAKIRLRGKAGQDAVLKVPPGVTIQDDKGTILRSLDEPGQTVVVAQGGEGGGPANNWLGSTGQARHVRLDLKLIADVGLVGFPNAGKSTLLKAISRARPKIAGYPFTTLRPNLGHLAYPDDRTITVADLPGLIEGAHYNVGMGHKFLKHVERTRLILFVVDVGGFRLNVNSELRSPFQTVALLNRELELYRQDLVLKPALCLVNKMDIDGADETFEMLKESLQNDGLYKAEVASLPEELRPETRIVFDEVIPMSAKFRASTVRHVKMRLRAWIDDHELRQRLESEKNDERELEDRMSAAKRLEIRLRDANVSKGPTVI